MQHLHFIVNPAAGGNSSLKRFLAVEAVLQQRRVPYSVVYSEQAGHATELARQALAADRGCIVAVGGDGTVREIAQVLVGSDMPMGIIPMGTGNDMVKALGIPTDPQLALESLLRGYAEPIDVASVGGAVFVNVCGFGFDVDVLEKTRHYKDRFRGKIAYILGVLHALLGLRSHRLKLVTSKGILTEDVILVAAGNGSYIGGGMMVAPQADVTDGLLDVCVVSRTGKLKVLYFLAKFIKGEHIDLDFVRYFQVESMHVECREPVPIQLDGEIIGKTPATIRVLPKALHVIMDREQSHRPEQI